MSDSPASQSGYAADRLSAEDRVAAEWVLRLRSGLSEAEEREFERWLALNPRHAAKFDELDATSRLLDQLRDPASAAVPSPALVPRQALGSRRFTVGLLAAAATIMLTGIGFWWPVLRAPAGEFFTHSVSVRNNQSQRLALPDGSTLQLAPGTTVEARFLPTERRVRLKEGEAYFTVAKSPERPFFVEAAALSVRAVGTAFNVRYEPRAIEVIVTEGRVSVDQAGQSVLPANDRAEAPAETRLLRAGEKAVITLPRTAPAPGSGGAAGSEAFPVATVEDWQARRLEFVNAPLAVVVAEFNRHNSHKLAIGEPALAQRTFGGVFEPTGYESLVEVLEQSFGIRVERTAGQTILHQAR